jgi:hypothetical protein
LSTPRRLMVRSLRSMAEVMGTMLRRGKSTLVS